MVIKSLDDEVYRDELHYLMAKALIRNAKCYKELEHEIKIRVQDKEKFMNGFKEFLFKHQASLNKDQDNEKDKEDLEEFDDCKLTRKKPGNGNLKRNVCNELQEDPEVLKLTNVQLDTMELS